MKSCKGKNENTRISSQSIHKFYAKIQIGDTPDLDKT